MSIENSSDSKAKLNQNRLSAIESFLKDSEFFHETLAEHQKNVYEDLQNFLKSGETRGYISLPTGTGKTVLFISMLEALGINSDSPSRALIVAPTINLVTQTIGQEGVRGFAEFSKNADIGTYYSLTPENEKDLSQNIVVTTYASFNSLASKNPQSIEQFDTIILDEAHHALGEKTREHITNLSPETLVLGFTATPEYHENKQLLDILPNKIHSIDLKEAIDEKLIAPILPVAINTDTTLSHLDLDEFGEYKQSNLKSLMHSDKRNALIKKAAEILVKNSHQVVINCIPGGMFFHPKMLAEDLNNIGINAASITSDTPKEARDKILKDFEDGIVDVLTSINILSEGWDSQAARAVINARPTRSKLVATQRIGRVLRNKPDRNYAIAIDLIDKFDTDSAPAISINDIFPEIQMTSFEAYGEVQDENAKSLRDIESKLRDNFDVIDELPKDYTQYAQLLENLPKLNKKQELSEQNSSGKVEVFAPLERMKLAYKTIISEDAASLLNIPGATREVRSGYSIRKVYSVNSIRTAVRNLPNSEKDGHYLLHDQHPDQKFMQAKDLVELLISTRPELIDQEPLINRTISESISTDPTMFLLCKKDKEVINFLGQRQNANEVVIYVNSKLAKTILKSVITELNI